MTDTILDATDRVPDLSLVLIQLFKGPLYRDTHEKLWDPLLQLRAAVSDHVAVLGLQVEVDESEGYAFLRSRPAGDDDDAMPRLMARRALSFHVEQRRPHRPEHRRPHHEGRRPRLPATSRG
jgi:hypothetical protein